ncbi:Maf family nucleotide pyrophosphatase [Pedobacter gandavensis]|uniref:dTTP/UTP pyrophosphatase n=1 Tax=Pedobacter gandavensis TaxID=2679963 RepID=A0ABR6F1S6_9SPHI|nr:Maf family nucleotide pyrophosphatase [Pedobacter gandavensis]MBB2151479.1 septum formation protein Maf [Pedobacter gandavensis]
MYQQKLPIILASKSPRRQELMKAMNLDFKVVLKEVDETYPEDLLPAEIAVYIAEKKAKAFDEDSKGSIIITADTIVAYNGEILGKPEDAHHATEMLTKLSGTNHQVYTGVSLTCNGEIRSFYDTTEVFFNTLTPVQIEYYIKNYQPMDKAGSYGIQDWIGLIAVAKIIGSYTNVMGLPTERLYKALAEGNWSV